jgi:hypothetical protein
LFGEVVGGGDQVDGELGDLAQVSRTPDVQSILLMRSYKYSYNVYLDIIY